MNAHDLRAWLRGQLEAYPGAVYRPHPHGGIAVPGFPSDCRKLVHSLAGARLVVTYNSNIGHDALLAGVPVACGPGAAYAELAGEALPSVEARRAYFSRVAYGQWTAAEMVSGEAQAFWLEHLLAEKPVEAEAQTVEQDDGYVPHSTESADDGLDAMDTDQLRALAKEQGVKVHARAGADKIRAALRAAA